MLREFCAENLTNVQKALKAGAQRVELCDDLSVGGVTPSDTVIAEAVELIHEHGAMVMVMVRPRGGDFAYDGHEIEAMEHTVSVVRKLGADGVVFGCVRDARLDEAATARLARAASGLDMTFHMAFDEIDPIHQPEALRRLVELGFSRILTHGGPLSQPIDACLGHLRDLVLLAGDAISIMPGGGVTWQNAEHISAELGVSEVHGTKIVHWE